MDRVNGANHIDLGGGKRGFRSRDTVAGQPGTEVTATFMNSVQEEICAVIEKNEALDVTKRDQLLRALMSGKIIYGADTGTADALVVALPHAPLALNDGMHFFVKKGANPNVTIAPTIVVNALPARTLKRRDGSDLASGDLAGNAMLLCVCEGADVRIVSFVASDMNLTATLPIFPEISSGGNAFTFTPSVGQIVVDTAQTWLHRGVKIYNTNSFVIGDRTFPTAASKTYHLVWDAPGTGLAAPLAAYPFGRFSLIDRTAASPVETDASYDTTYDRMLLARVVTSAGNVLTVNALINRSRLLARYEAAESFTRTTSVDGGLVAPFATATLNWSRTPVVSLFVSRGGFTGIVPQIPEEAQYFLAGTFSDGSGSATASNTRYGVRAVSHTDMNASSVSLTMFWQLSGIFIN